MLKTFEALKKNFKLKPQEIIIDNLVFKLHYRATGLFLLVGSILVSSQQYIGEHIHCINDKGVQKNVMDTFCFFTTTFTVNRHMNQTLVDMGALPHPGVGPYIPGVDEEIHHAYYQWVPFVLFGQAIAFFLPHYIWKRHEGGRIKNIVSGLQYAAFSLCDKEVVVNKDRKIPAMATRDLQLEEVKRTVLQRLHVNRSWSIAFVGCEILNALNIFLQVYLTNLFLGGQFYSLGPDVLHTGLDGEANTLDIVFPKVTKCTFHKYGASGTIQAHDAMCVMALNIINEKIFTFLWFWYVVLGVATLLGLLWRVITIILHSRSQTFNRMVFSTNCPGKLNPWQVLHVTREFHFADWLFLYYLSKNMDSFTFMKLFIGMAESMDDNMEKHNLLDIDFTGNKEHEKLV